MDWLRQLAEASWSTFCLWYAGHNTHRYSPNQVLRRSIRRMSDVKGRRCFWGLGYSDFLYRVRAASKCASRFCCYRCQWYILSYRFSRISSTDGWVCAENRAPVGWYSRVFLRYQTHGHQINDSVYNIRFIIFYIFAWVFVYFIFEVFENWLSACPWG